MNRDISRLQEALLDLNGLLNRPQPDAALLAQAGVALDRALFPLLVRIGRRGPLAIGELADLCGRDYSTVSRQVAKLESLGLVARRSDREDGRITNSVLTAKGRTTTQALDQARDRLMSALLADWEARDVAELGRLLRRLADDANAFIQERSG